MEKCSAHSLEQCLVCSRENPQPRAQSKSWQPPYVDPATIPDENWFVRRALRRWAAERSELGSLHSGKSIRDFILEEFLADGGSPDHPDYVRLGEFLDRQARSVSD